MKKLLSLSSSFCVVLFFIGCAIATLSPQQRRALQIKHFKSSYNNVFRAFKTILQDEGYIIKNQDMRGGLIVAHASKNPSGFFSKMLVLDNNNNRQTGVTFEVSVNLEKIRRNYIESRVIIQQIDTFSSGGTRGQEVVSPELYQNIYSKVRVEIARRKAQGR